MKSEVYISVLAMRIDSAQNLPAWSLEMLQNPGCQILQLGWIEYNCAQDPWIVRGLNTGLAASWVARTLYLLKPHLVFLIVKHQEVVLYFDIEMYRECLVLGLYVDHLHHNLLEIKHCVGQTYSNAARLRVEFALVFRIVEADSLRYYWRWSSWRNSDAVDHMLLVVQIVLWQNPLKAYQNYLDLLQLVIYRPW